MSTIYEHTDHDDESMRVQHRLADNRDLLFSGRAFVPYAEVIKLRDALNKHIEEHKRELPRGGAVQFRAGEIAVWRPSILAWMVTGYERAWGDPEELVRRFGDDWVELVSK